MSNVYVIADLHLAHANCAKWRGFSNVEEHDETIISRWNEVITKRDVVWVLGDVTMNLSGLSQAKRLMGTKHLVLGNHDHHNVQKYVNIFNKIRGLHNYKNLALLSHAPLHPSVLGDRWYAKEGLINIHGHQHNLGMEEDPRYINVAAEHLDYTPRRIQDVLMS